MINLLPDGVSAIRQARRSRSGWHHDGPIEGAGRLL